MASFQHIVGRASVANSEENPTMVTLIAVLFALIFVIVLAVGVLFLFRRMRMRRQNMTPLPQYNDVKRTGNHRQLTITTPGPNGRSSTIVINSDGQPMLANPLQPPHSPDNVPEIHITFPDEHDEQGRTQSGRRVIVRVGDTSVGLEPVNDEKLPAYEKESKTEFHAIDIDQIGGLKEKEYRP